MPVVSVIVPNYNHAPFLRQRIDSILAQTYQDFELILLDDCSTDDSRAVLSQYAGNPRIRIEFNKVNGGSPYPQWAKGVRMSRGKYVWIAESDDYADPRLLERLVGVLESDSRIVLTYCRSCVQEADGRQAGFADRYAPHDDPSRWDNDYVTDGREECARYFTYDNIVANTSSAVFRRAAWDEVGGVDETMRTSGDWKLWAAIALTGKVAYISEPLNFYRKHGQTVRSRASAARVVTEELEAVQWIFERVNASREVRAKAGKVAASRWVPMVVSSHVPREMKGRVLRSVLAVDPHPVWHAMGPALFAARMKARRHCREIWSAVIPSRSL